MPAVLLSQLRTKIDQLIWNYTRPADFVRDLKDLLEYYSNRGVYRAGKNKQPVRQINTYYTAPLILKELEKELVQKINENPAAGLPLADALWLEDFLELRLISAFILGQLPVTEAEQVTQRLSQWAGNQQPLFSLTALLERASLKLRREKPEIYLNLLREWLSAASVSINKTGIEALISLVKDPEFLDLPRVYSIITPLVKRVPAGLQGEMRVLLSALIQRSPRETSYFMNQIVLITPNQGTKRLLRSVMNELPEDLRTKLRNVVNDPDFSV
ncbi:MAG: hypothetical protein LWX83_07735 [Anaerolineae bacterium]|nr:hypothetical protein [Anaerolineae bacterium]